LIQSWVNLESDKIPAKQLFIQIILIRTNFLQSRVKLCNKNVPISVNPQVWYTVTPTSHFNSILAFSEDKFSKSRTDQNNPTKSPSCQHTELAPFDVSKGCGYVFKYLHFTLPYMVSPGLDSWSWFFEKTVKIKNVVLIFSHKKKSFWREHFLKMYIFSLKISQIWISLKIWKKKNQKPIFEVSYNKKNQKNQRLATLKIEKQISHSK
jgi:hypothetical protein